MAKSKPTKMLAFLGRSRRTGRWRLASRSSVLAVLGSCYLDMTDSFVDDQDKLRMSVTVFLGSATFILPDGAEVRPSGMAILAASMVDVPEHDEQSDLPTLDIEWNCVFGRVRILSEDAALALDEARRQKRLEKAIRKGKAVPEDLTTGSAPTTQATDAVKSEPASGVSAKPKRPKKQPAEPKPTPAGVGFDDLPEVVPAAGGVGFDDLPAAAEPDPEVVPAAGGVGFDDLPPATDPEPAVAGVGFGDLPAVADPEPEPADVEPEPVVTGIGFEDIPAAAEPEPEPAVVEPEPTIAEPEPEPVVTGVGFEDVPAAAEPEPEPAVAEPESESEPVTSVGFVDEPTAEAAPEEASEPTAAAEPAPAEPTPAADGGAESRSGRPSVDVGFVDIPYEPETAAAAEAAV